MMEAAAGSRDGFYRDWGAKIQGDRATGSERLPEWVAH